ncbi:MAG: FixH family protein [Planctomycetota bacterium]
MTTLPIHQETRQGASGRHWPLVVVGLLGLNVSVCATTVYFATRDGPVAVEPDYYQRAMDWDARRAATPDVSARGWATDVESVDGTALVRLTDAQGDALIGASVVASGFHRAFSRDRHDLTFVEVEPGVYRVALPGAMLGFWELRLRVTHDGIGAVAVETIERRE